MAPASGCAITLTLCHEMSALAKLRRIFDWCLRACGLVFLYAAVISAVGIWMQWELLPPENVKDIESFQKWRPEFTEAKRMEIRGSVFFAVRGPYARPMPSAKSEYYFDSKGNYLGWNVDPGDDKTPSLFFSKDAKHSIISIDEIPKPGTTTAAEETASPSPGR